MALAAAVLVEALPGEVALLQEGVVSMDLDSLVVLEVVLRLVGPVRVVLQVVLQVVLWGAVRVVIHHWNCQDHWGHQKEVDDGCLYCPSDPSSESWDPGRSSIHIGLSVVLISSAFVSCKISVASCCGSTGGEEPWKY